MPKKDILFIGDSITEGNTGESYLKILKKKLDKESCNIYNHGLGGDTLLGVKTRLIELISGGKKFDVIVIEAGHNDIVLPYLGKNDPAWQKGVQMLKDEGIIPTPDPADFEINLENTLKFLKENHTGVVIITTLSCLGEDLDSELNKKRELFNDIIREKGNYYEYKIADVGRAFEEELENKQEKVIKKELVKTFLNPSQGFEDNIKTFFLTFDGVHINERGAELYAKEIMKELSFFI